MSSESLAEVLRSNGFQAEEPNIRLISSGKGCQLYSLEDGEVPLFIKQYPADSFDQVLAEGDGLRVLGENPYTSAPKVHIEKVENGMAVLAMDFIQSSANGRKLAMKEFGRQLASLHKSTQNTNYGYHRDNYIGALKQENERVENWGYFYYHRRLKPQMDMAINSHLLPANLTDDPDKWIRTINKVCPDEPACLTHGDLWAGNMIATDDGQPYLIDPAVGYTHREMDLAMTKLFGGFSENFYKAYDDIWPLEPDFNFRVQIYQLYYLLVHVNLFGRSYTGQTMSAINRFFS